MTKEVKILSVLSLTVFVLAMYIWIGSRRVRIADDGKSQLGNGAEIVQEKPAPDLVKIESDYRENTKNILRSYEEMINEEDLLENSEKIKEVNDLEDDLIGLTVPEEFKNLHVNFVLALNKIESYAKNGNKEDMSKGLLMIQEIKNQYTWTN